MPLTQLPSSVIRCIKSKFVDRVFETNFNIQAFLNRISSRRSCGNRRTSMADTGEEEEKDRGAKNGYD